MKKSANHPFCFPFSIWLSCARSSPPLAQARLVAPHARGCCGGQHTCVAVCTQTCLLQCCVRHKSHARVACSSVCSLCVFGYLFTLCIVSALLSSYFMSSYLSYDYLSSPLILQLLSFTRPSFTAPHLVAPQFISTQ